MYHSPTRNNQEKKMGFYQNAVKMMLGIAGKSKDKMYGRSAGKGKNDGSESYRGGRGQKASFKKKATKPPSSPPSSPPKKKKGK